MTIGGRSGSAFLRSFAVASILGFAPTVALPVSADELVLSASGPARELPLTFVYRLQAPRSGSGVLTVEWTDGIGDLVERRAMPVALHNQSTIRFTLDPRRGLVMSNALNVNFRAAGYQGHAEASFIIPPSKPNWADYQLVIWQPQTAQAYEALETIGVNAAMTHANRSAPAQIFGDELNPIVASGIRPYIENIATDFYSAYHRYFPDKPVNWRFVATQAIYDKNPHDSEAFIRSPSLSDPSSLAGISKRLRETVAVYRSYGPLFYNLADEPGIADLNAYWDFDFSAPSLAAMRIWLKARYGTLGALNREWGSHFLDWNAVMPATTDAAMSRADENYASWSDFKEWMDVAFARAVMKGRDAVHAADPNAFAGLEGVQKPRWGGYNYELLAHAVDVIEGDAAPQDLDLLRSLNPRLRLLTTSSVGDPLAEHIVWRALLQGARGLILWDEDHKLVSAEGTLGPTGQVAGPYLREIRDGIGALLTNSRAAPTPVAILYSPESLRVQWMLDWRGKGNAWASRKAEDEWRDDGAVRGEMNAYRRGLEQLGIEPRYVSSAMIEQGSLHDGKTRLLMLPHVVALSRIEAQSLRRFAARGGRIVADTAPGRFDSHGRKLDTPRLASLFGDHPDGPWRHGLEQLDLPISENDGADPHGRILQDGLQHLSSVLHEAGIEPRLVIRDKDGHPVTDITQRAWHNGNVVILALQRDFTPNSSPAETVTVRLPAPGYIYDVRGKAFLGRKRDLEITLDDTAPAILADSPAALPQPVVSLPRKAQPGQPIHLALRFPSASPAAYRVLHITVTDPAGKQVTAYSGNLIVRGDVAEKDFWLPQSAKSGTWRIGVADVLSGKSEAAVLWVGNGERVQP